MTAPRRRTSPVRVAVPTTPSTVIDAPSSMTVSTQAAIGAELKNAVLAAARCVAARLCARIGRTHVAPQIIEDLIARDKVANARLDALVREKMAQAAAAEGAVKRRRMS